MGQDIFCCNCGTTVGERYFENTIIKNMNIDVISAKIKEINTIFPADIRIVHCNKIDVSSTMIRSNIKKHQDITGILPGKVIDYIRQNELYR